MVILILNIRLPQRRYFTERSSLGEPVPKESKLMTLFLSMPGRSYQISDFYVMALTFVILFSVTKIVKEVIQKA